MQYLILLCLEEIVYKPRLNTKFDLSLGQTCFSARENISCVSSLIYVKLSLMLYTHSTRLNFHSLSSKLYNIFSLRENEIR